MRSSHDLVKAIDSLTAGQVEVLQLVAQFKSSKEIGRELGISHHTVDQRIKRIQSILGVSTRAEAARMFVAMTPGSNPVTDIWGDLVYQSPELSGQDFSSIPTSSSVERNPTGDVGNSELREAQAQYFAGDFDRFGRPAWFSVLFEASRKNELTLTARTIVIALIMLTSLLALGALISLAEGISRIF
ncbi:MAG: helix-turn-helix transcriptional regulator [Sphingorhabdus sp.]